MDNIEKLKLLYIEESKHSNYQIFSNKLNNVLEVENTIIKNRYEEERLKFILDNFRPKDKTILDIGGNTGYFSFELIDKGSSGVTYFEGNKNHADFVSLGAKVLGCQYKITIKNYYYTFTNNLSKEIYDITLLLNVLHHVGDDYGNRNDCLIMAKEKIIAQLNFLASKTKKVVFQLGFNWKGQIGNGLFTNGTKEEMIDFIKQGTEDYWEIEKIGIAEKSESLIVYNELNSNNIKRDNSLGEFLNRPMFILKSKI